MCAKAAPVVYGIEISFVIGNALSLANIPLILLRAFRPCDKDAKFLSFGNIFPSAADSKSFWAALAMLWIVTALKMPFAKKVISKPYKTLSVSMLSSVA